MNTVVIASLIAVAAILLAYVLFRPRIVEEPSKPKRRSDYPACGCMHPKLDSKAKPKRFMPPIIQDSDTLILRKFSTSAVQVGDAIHMISKEGGLPDILYHCWLSESQYTPGSSGYKRTTEP